MLMMWTAPVMLVIPSASHGNLGLQRHAASPRRIHPGSDVDGRGTAVVE
jgi:hypothetical protein